MGGGEREGGDSRTFHYVNAGNSTIPYKVERRASRKPFMYVVYTPMESKNRIIKAQSIPQ